MAALVACSWYGMMATHEFGHTVAAWLSGGRVSRIDFPLLGFSQTELSRNPHPLVVCWGGAIGGSIFPVLLWLIARAAKSRLRRAIQFFAGFCLIANGAYLGAGSFIATGDAGDLMRFGTPQWILLVSGATMTGCGLYLWHLLGRRFGVGTTIRKASQEGGRACEHAT